MTDKLTILIVDDEIVSRYTLGALLEEDYTLFFAENGPQGLEKAETIIPDLILLDVMMPNMNGFEVCRRLRAHPQLANLPVAMITAWDDPTARSRCLEIGANEVICKPFDRNSLDELIHKLIQSTDNKT